MAIEDELFSFIGKYSAADASKNRNIEIVAFYYGFRGEAWPTLEDTATAFNNITRERVRQLINSNFKDKVDKSQIPSAEIIAKVISSRRYWMQSDLELVLVDKELVSGDFSIRGLLNLLEDLGINNNYDIYSPDVKKAKRSTINSYEELFLLKNEDAAEIHALYKKAEKLPGRCGIANLDYLKTENNNFITWVSLLKEMIRFTPKSWVKATANEFWYLFEDKSNTLINFSEKVFSVFDTCETSKLAMTYRNAFDRRTHNYPYPPVEIIADYLRSSIYFSNIHDVLYFTGDPEPISEIEENIVQYIKENGAANYQSVFKYLVSKNYKKPHIDKTLLYSPLVYVDKSKGFGNHDYSLVGHLIGNLPVEPTAPDRYKIYLKKLRDIADNGTDETSEHKRRKEQGILQDWLFEGKTQETCAICGKKYSVHALVSAHKKKRSKCNTAERLDPNIVMPLCLFGCDYLYEKRLVYIEDGLVHAGNLSEYEDEEKKVIEKLINKKVDERWLEGLASYFEKS